MHLNMSSGKCGPSCLGFSVALTTVLTHSVGATHICVTKLTIIGWDNGLLPGHRQAIIWTNAGILLIGPLRTKFSEIFIKIYIFSLKKMLLKMSSGKWRLFWLRLNVLTRLYILLTFAYMSLQHCDPSWEPLAMTQWMKEHISQCKCNIHEGPV